MIPRISLCGCVYFFFCFFFSYSIFPVLFDQTNRRDVIESDIIRLNGKIIAPRPTRRRQRRARGERVEGFIFDEVERGKRVCSRGTTLSLPSRILLIKPPQLLATCRCFPTRVNSLRFNDLQKFLLSSFQFFIIINMIIIYPSLESYDNHRSKGSSGFSFVPSGLCFYWNNYEDNSSSIV